MSELHQIITSAASQPNDKYCDLSAFTEAVHERMTRTENVILEPQTDLANLNRLYEAGLFGHAAVLASGLGYIELSKKYAQSCQDEVAGQLNAFNIQQPQYVAAYHQKLQSLLARAREITQRAQQPDPLLFTQRFGRLLLPYLVDMYYEPREYVNEWTHLKIASFSCADKTFQFGMWAGAADERYTLQDFDIFIRSFSGLPKRWRTDPPEFFVTTDSSAVSQGQTSFVVVSKNTKDSTQDYSLNVEEWSIPGRQPKDYMNAIYRAVNYFCSSVPLLAQRQREKTQIYDAPESAALAFATLFSPEEHASLEARTKAALKAGSWQSVPRLSLGPKQLPGITNTLTPEQLIKCSGELIEYLTRSHIIPAGEAEELVARKLVHHFVHQRGFQLSRDRAQELLLALRERNDIEALPVRTSQ